jgi:transcriptional regulator with XRE-family HTH domain
MSYATTNITEKLKAAREARGLSQRELGQLAGVPQSHISKIESGSVDLRVSSLIELSRALGLELKLIPRNTLPAVNTIVRGSEGNTKKLGRSTPTVQRELKRIDDTVTSLIRENPASKELAQIQNQARYRNIRKVWERSEKSSPSFSSSAMHLHTDSPNHCNLKW